MSNLDPLLQTRTFLDRIKDGSVKHKWWLLAGYTLFIFLLGALLF